MTVGEFLAIAVPELSIAVKDEQENISWFCKGDTRLDSTIGKALANIPITGFEPGENPEVINLLVGGD